MMHVFYRLLLISTFCGAITTYAQLKDVKILIPKEIPYSMSDVSEFSPDGKYFFILGNALAVYNTETAEIVDDADIGFGAKNLSVSSDGEFVLVTANTDLYIFQFKQLKLKLIQKVNTVDLIKGLPNAIYYGLIPINAAFFVDKHDIYVAVGGFTILFDFIEKKVKANHTFTTQETITHAKYLNSTKEVVLAKSSGTVHTLCKQALANLSDIKEFAKHANVAFKLKLKKSILFCFNTDAVLTCNLNTGKIVHEIMMPKYKYEKEDQNIYTDEMNKRVPVTVFDNINFGPNEFIYDADVIQNGEVAVYATLEGLKFIDLKTKKLKQHFKQVGLNIQVSPSQDRMLFNAGSAKSIRIYDPNEMKLISERNYMGTSMNYVNISPGGKWLFTGSGAVSALWDLSNYSKYCELKDISESDSSYVHNAFFLNDSEIVVNSASSVNSRNLAIFNIYKKRYTKIIKRGIFAFSSGFKNNEFYYTDLKSLHIVDLKTMQEEVYKGMFSLAASPLYKVVDFNAKHVFIPEAGKFKIVERKTEKVIYEHDVWAISSRVILSERDNSLFTLAQIKKKKVFSGTEVEIPTQAIIRIDLNEGKVKNDYVETMILHDFYVNETSSTLSAWYVKYEMGKYNDSLKVHIFAEFDVVSGEKKSEKVISVTKDHMPFHNLSASGKYFSLNDMYGKYFKVFDQSGEEIIDLSDMNISYPNCFFLENSELLVITSPLNALATFVDLKNKKLVGQLANGGGDNFFMITPDLHYMGSKEFIKSIRFKLSSEIFSFDQFDAYLNQPHQVLRSFLCRDSSLIHAYETAYLKRMKILGLKPNSTIRFSDLPKFDKVVMKGDKQKIQFQVSANKGINNFKSISVYNNGTKIWSEALNNVESARIEKEFNFTASSGMNRFEFILSDVNGLESEKITRFYNNTELVKPNLYLVVIASEKFKNADFNLAYASKDASDVANTMTQSKSFDSIYSKKILNENFNTDSVKLLKNYLGRAGINDLIMIFYAGHGYLDTDLNYYFPTYYTDFSDPKINSVSYKEFEKIFAEVKPLRKLMFIDACFSGEVDVDVIKNEKDKNSKKDSSRLAGTVLFSQSSALEMSKAIFTDLRQHSGVTVISSAGGTEAAWEDEKWKNGLFTYCMLRGMKEYKADLDKNGKVTLNELQKYVSEEVNRLSKGEQTPTFRVENSVLDYELW
ncbi:MAG: caspase family protein [Sphingobacteriaceae bacterium]|nr:caspase family protein [Sphingobacteriaceae bacterium]